MGEIFLLKSRIDPRCLTTRYYYYDRMWYVVDKSVLAERVYMRANAKEGWVYPLTRILNEP